MKRIYDWLFYFNIGAIAVTIALAWLFQAPQLSEPVVWFVLSAVAFRIAGLWEDER